MDENKLLWIAAVVIVAIGVSYMLWLALTYTRIINATGGPGPVIKVTPEPEAGE